MTPQRLAQAAVCVLLIAAGLCYWQHPPKPDIPPALVKTIDSLTATEGAFDSVTTTALAGVDRQAEVDRRLAARERALRALDDTLKARKDSLALIAMASPDSAPAWRAAYVAADSLATARQTTIDTLRARVDTLTSARDTLRMTVDRALDRLHVTQDALKDLRAAADKMTSTTLLDYVAIGCGYGIKGADCIVGIRIPLGRKVARVTLPNPLPHR